MAILRCTNHIEDKYLKVLVCSSSIYVSHEFCYISCNLIFSFDNFQVRDRDLYNDTDTEVKRQIWRDNQSLFGDEVSPLLTQYIREKETVLFDHMNLTNLFFNPSPKVVFFCTRL